MKKILFFTHYPGVGGANLSMVYLIVNLRKYHNIESTVFLPMKGPIEEVLVENNIHYEVYRYASWRTENQGRVKNAIRAVIMLILNFIQLLRLKRRLRCYDLFYQNSSKVIFGVMAKSITGKPVVWHLREFGTTDYPMVYLFPNKIVQKCFLYADHVIAISKEIENYYKKIITDKANYSVIYNGVEDSRFNTNKHIEPFKYPLKICIVGGINESKNQLDLIEAVSILKSKGYKLKVDLIGPNDSEYAGLIHRKIQEFEIEDFVHIKGQQIGIEKILDNYDVGVITSKCEAFGRVIIEYMLSGLTVIGSNKGACPEIIKDGFSGLLYQLGNSVNLAEKIERIYNDAEFAKLLAHNGRQKALSEFTAKINASQIGELINKL